MRALILWAVCLLGIAGPLLLQLGYAPWDREFLALALGTLPVAAIIAPLTGRFPTLRVAVAAALIVLALDAYSLDIEDPFKAAAVATAALAAAWPLRERLLPVLSAGAAALLIATAATGDFGWPESLPPRVASPASAGPTFIHVVLDEHAGPGGLPPEIFSPEDIRAAAGPYLRSGFRVGTAVRATSGFTQDSLAAVLNDADRASPDLVEHGARAHRLRRNAYFAAFVARGYRVGVLQNSFLDFCPPGLGSSVTCRTYPHYSAAALRGLELGWRDRAAILAGLVDQSLRTTHGSYLYTSLMGSEAAAGAQGWLTAYGRWRIQPLVSMQLLPWLGAEIRRAGRGELLFAHLLLPHYPYAYDAHCRLRPVGEWLDRTEADGTLDLAGRERRFRAYRQQLACTDAEVMRLVALAAANPALADAVFIVHGDHGSRIAPDRFRPLGDGYDETTFARDWFATLYAVRGRGFAGGMADEPQSLREALWGTLRAAGI